MGDRPRSEIIPIAIGAPVVVGVPFDGSHLAGAGCANDQEGVTVATTQVDNANVTRARICVFAREDNLTGGPVQLVHDQAGSNKRVGDPEGVGCLIVAPDIKCHAVRVTRCYSDSPLVGMYHETVIGARFLPDANLAAGYLHSELVQLAGPGEIGEKRVKGLPPENPVRLQSSGQLESCNRRIGVFTGNPVRSFWIEAGFQQCELYVFDVHDRRMTG